MSFIEQAFHWCDQLKNDKDKQDTMQAWEDTKSIQNINQKT
jgi:hypothetical protein